MYIQGVNLSSWNLIREFILKIEKSYCKTFPLILALLLRNCPLLSTKFITSLIFFWLDKISIYRIQLKFQFGSFFILLFRQFWIYFDFIYPPYIPWYPKESRRCHGNSWWLFMQYRLNFLFVKKCFLFVFTHHNWMVST